VEDPFGLPLFTIVKRFLGRVAVPCIHGTVSRQQRGRGTTVGASRPTSMKLTRGPFCGSELFTQRGPRSVCSDLFGGPSSRRRAA
jgi:hypothetical protein